MENIMCSYRLVVTVTCLVCLGFGSGVCSEFDPLIKTSVSSPQLSNETLVYSNGIDSITESDLDSLVTKSELPVLVTFTASWCGPCRYMMPTLNKLETTYKNKINFYTVDADNEKGLAKHFNLLVLPTTFIFKGASVSGANIAKLKELVEKFV